MWSNMSLDTNAQRVCCAPVIFALGVIDLPHVPEDTQCAT
jgi:hypothetical protein